MTDFHHLPQEGAWLEQDPGFVEDFLIIHPIAQEAQANYKSDKS